MFDALDTNIQTYFREAVQKLDVKVYELTLLGDNFSQTIYFCCRVEFGVDSVYFTADGESLNKENFNTFEANTGQRNTIVGFYNS